MKPLGHTISSQVTESFYALMKNNKFLHADEWTVEAGKAIPILTDDPTEAYTLRNKDRANWHLEEYSQRLKGFKVVHVEETVIKSYKIL